MRMGRKLTIFLCMSLLSLFCMFGATSCGNILNIYCDDDKHEFVEERIEATCGEEGLLTITCKLCPYKKETVLQATGRHTYENVSGKAATCTTNGYTDYKKCKVCGEEKDKTVLNKTGHTETRKATCQNKAYCGKCNSYYGSKLNHKLVEIKVAAKTATCTENGWDEYIYCGYEGCTYTTLELISALGHDGERANQNGVTARVDSKVGNCIEEAFCGYCREFYVPKTSHDVKCEHKDSKKATCETAAYCGACKEYYGEALGHNLKTYTKIIPTCVSDGNYCYVVCSRCDVFKECKIDATVPQLGHDKVTMEKAPTCTEYGIKEVSLCIYCEAAELFKAMEHRDEYKALYGNDWEKKHKRECTNVYCKYILEPLGHDVACNNEHSIKGNCINQSYCGVCKEYYGEVVEQHTLGTPATCESGPICKVCKEEYAKPREHLVSGQGVCLLCKKEVVEE